MEIVKWRSTAEKLESDLAHLHEKEDVKVRRVGCSITYYLFRQG